MTSRSMSKKQIAQIAMDMTSNIYMNSTTKFNSGISQFDAKHTNIQELKQRALNSIALKTNPDKKLSIQKISQLGSSPLFKGLDSVPDRKAKTLEKQQRQISWKITSSPNPQDKKNSPEKSNPKEQKRIQQKKDEKNILSRQHNRKVQNQVNSSRYKGNTTQEGNVVTKGLNKSNKMIRDDFYVSAKTSEIQRQNFHVKIKVPEKQTKNQYTYQPSQIRSNNKKQQVYVYPRKNVDLQQSRALSQKNQSKSFQKLQQKKQSPSRPINKNIEIQKEPTPKAGQNLSPSIVQNSGLNQKKSQIINVNKVIMNSVSKVSPPKNQVTNSKAIVKQKSSNPLTSTSKIQPLVNVQTQKLQINKNYASTPTIVAIKPIQPNKSVKVQISKKEPYVYVPPVKVIRESAQKKEHEAVSISPKKVQKQVQPTKIQKVQKVIQKSPISQPIEQKKTIISSTSQKNISNNNTTATNNISQIKSSEKLNIKPSQINYNQTAPQSKLNEIKKTPQQSRVIIQRQKPIQKVKPNSIIPINNASSQKNISNISNNSNNKQKSSTIIPVATKTNSTTGYVYQPPKKVERQISPVLQVEVQKKSQPQIKRTSSPITQKIVSPVNIKNQAPVINKALIVQPKSQQLKLEIKQAKPQIIQNKNKEIKKQKQKSFQVQKPSETSRSILKNKPQISRQVSPIMTDSNNRERKNVHLRSQNVSQSKNISLSSMKELNKYQKSYTPQKSKEKLPERGRVAMNMISNIFMNSSTRFFPGLQSLMGNAQELKKKALDSPMFKHHKSQQKIPSIRIIQSKSQQKLQQIQKNARTSPSRPKIQRVNQQAHLGQSHSVYKTKQPQLQKKGSNNLVSKQLSKEKVITRDDSYAYQKKKIEKQSPKSKESPTTFKRDIDSSKKEYNQMKKLKQKEPNTQIIKPISIYQKKKNSSTTYVYQPPQPVSQRTLKDIQEENNKNRQKNQLQKKEKSITNIKSVVQKNKQSQKKVQPIVNPNKNYITKVQIAAQNVSNIQKKTQPNSLHQSKVVDTNNNIKKQPIISQTPKQKKVEINNLNKKFQQNNISKISNVSNISSPSNANSSKNIKQVQNTPKIEQKQSLNLVKSQKSLTTLPLSKNIVKNDTNIIKNITKPIQVSKLTQTKTSLLILSIKKLFRNKIQQTFELINNSSQNKKNRRTSKGLLIYHRLKLFVENYQKNRKAEIIDILKKKQLAHQQLKAKNINIANSTNLTNQRNKSPDVKRSQSPVLTTPINKSSNQSSIGSFYQSAKIKVLQSLDLIFKLKKKVILQQSFKKIFQYKKHKQEILNALAALLNKVKSSSVKNKFQVFKIANLVSLKTKTSGGKLGLINNRSADSLKINLNSNVNKSQTNLQYPNTSKTNISSNSQLASSRSFNNLPSSNNLNFSKQQSQYQIKKNKKIQEFQNKVSDIQRKKSQIQQQIAFENKQKRQKTKINNELKVKIQSSPAIVEQHEEVTSPIRKSKSTSSALSEANLIPKLTKIYASLFEGDEQSIKIQKFLTTYNDFLNIDINQRLITEWKLIRENSELKQKVKQYQGEQPRQKKINQLMSEESSLLGRLLKSFIRERYIWEWVNIIANE